MKMSQGQGIWGPFGNPDLKPQRTTMYELGLQQQIAENIASTSPVITATSGLGFHQRSDIHLCFRGKLHQNGQ
jgi:hypothetical protein